MFKFQQPKSNSDIKSNSDCMIRAVSNATNKPYSEVHKIMYKHGWRAARKNSKGHFESQITNTLTELGFNFERISCPAKKGEPRITAWDLPKDGTYIIRVSKHVSCIKDGELLDTWNCSNKCVYFYWKVW